MTKRPTTRKARGALRAAKLLSEAEVRDRLRLDEDAIAALNACCTLRPPRNAASIVSGIKTRLEYSQPKPKQELDLGGNVTFALVDPFARPPG